MNTKASTKGVQPPSENSQTKLESAEEKHAAEREQASVGTRSEHGRRIGRPVKRVEKLKPVPTRCPTQIYTYLKGITPFLYPSLTEMFADMLKRFITERPWEHGLHWRKPKTAMTLANGVAGKTGWEQVNIQLLPEQALEVAKTAEECGVSAAAFCYTAIFWWVQYIYPPEKMMPKK
jgi:hypothetical protein